MDTLKISDDKQLKEIKAIFSAKFPHLRLEFYSESHEIGEASAQSSKYDDQLFLKDIRSSHNSGEMSIDGSMLTSELEMGFKERFGVNVQVLRKSGNMWIQSTTTDRWTLDHQEEDSQKNGF